jgi:hypothetical protein
LRGRRPAPEILGGRATRRTDFRASCAEDPAPGESGATTTLIGESAMARVYLFTNPNRMKLVYSVDQPVGPGCPNRRDDVLLVQFLLRVAMEDNPPKNVGYRPPDERPITVDGLFGRQTAAYIRYFQEEDGRRVQQGQFQFAPATDGRIDPVASGTAFGAHSKTLYTIVDLNIVYVNRHGTQLHENISRDPLFPKELTKSLFLAT